MNNLIFCFIFTLIICQNVIAQTKTLGELSKKNDYKKFKFKIIPHEELYMHNIDSENLIYYGMVDEGKMKRGIMLIPHSKEPIILIYVGTIQIHKKNNVISISLRNAINVTEHFCHTCKLTLRFLISRHQDS